MTISTGPSTAISPASGTGGNAAKAVEGGLAGLFALLLPTAGTVDLKTPARGPQDETGEDGAEPGLELTGQTNLATLLYAPQVSVAAPASPQADGDCGAFQETTEPEQTPARADFAAPPKAVALPGETPAAKSARTAVPATPPATGRQISASPAEADISLASEPGAGAQEARGTAGAKAGRKMNDAPVLTPPNRPSVPPARFALASVVEGQGAALAVEKTPRRDEEKPSPELGQTSLSDNAANLPLALPSAPAAFVAAPAPAAQNVAPAAGSALLTTAQPQWAVPSATEQPIFALQPNGTTRQLAAREWPAALAASAILPAELAPAAGSAPQPTAQVPAAAPDALLPAAVSIAKAAANLLPEGPSAVSVGRTTPDAEVSARVQMAMPATPAATPSERPPGTAKAPEVRAKPAAETNVLRRVLPRQSAPLPGAEPSSTNLPEAPETVSASPAVAERRFPESDPFNPAMPDPFAPAARPTPAPAPGAPPAARPMAPAAVVEEVGLGLERLQQQSHSRLEMRISLEGGGEVTIALQMRDGAVHAAFVTGSEELRAALAHGWSHLAERSESLGIPLAAPVFKAPPTATTAGGQQDFREPSRHHPQQPERPPSTPLNTNPSFTTRRGPTGPPVRPTATTAGLNAWA